MPKSLLNYDLVSSEVDFSTTAYRYRDSIADVQQGQNYSQVLSCELFFGSIDQHVSLHTVVLYINS